jgi:hypothetical protein
MRTNKVKLFAIDDIQNGSCFLLAIMMWERRRNRLVLFLSLFNNRLSRMRAGQ